jgi:hypothetical protein
MKKKSTLALVLLMIMISTLVHAVSYLGDIEFYEWLIINEAELGPCGEWSYDEKITLLKKMADVGLVERTDEAVLSESELDANQQAIDNILSETFGDTNNYTLNVDRIMQSQLGRISSWTLEEQAWLSYTKDKYVYSERNGRYEMYVMPEANDALPDDVVSAAKLLVSTEFELDQKKIDEMQIELSLVNDVTDDGIRKTYYVLLYDDFCENNPYVVTFTGDGRFIGRLAPDDVNNNDINEQLSKDFEHFGTYETKPAFVDKWAPRISDALDRGDHVKGFYQHICAIPYFLPTSNDITLAEAQSIATSALAGNHGLDEDTIANYTLYESFRLNDHGIGVWHLKYIVSTLEAYDLFWAGGINEYGFVIILDGESGEVIEITTVDIDEPFSQAAE